MAKYEIAKSFDFCYGHRVHTQVLDENLSCNSKCKCRHQHGHQGLLNVYLESDELNMQGMVFDFVNLNFVKKFIDDVVDHKMILDIQDPLLPIFYPILSNCIPTDVRSVDYHYEFHREGYFTVRTEQYTGVVREIYDGLVLVPFIPTSENLAKWFYGIVSSKLNNLARVSKIEFYETPKSKSVYYSE